MKIMITKHELEQLMKKIETILPKSYRLNYSISKQMSTFE